MGSTTRKFLWVIAAIVTLFVVAAIAFSLLFDANSFRDNIASAVKEETGRELVIEGDIGLTIFPWLAIDIGHTTLGNAPGFGDEPFAEFERARLSVRLMPMLFGGTISIGTAELDGLRLNLAVNARGADNWADLAPADSGEADVAAEVPGEAPQLDIAGVKLRDAAIVYADAQTGDRYALSAVNVSLGSIASDGSPVPVDGSLEFDLQPAGISGNIELDTVLSFDNESGRLALDGLSVGGMIEGIAEVPTQLELSTDSIEVLTNEQLVAMETLEVGILGITLEVELLERMSYAGAVQPYAAIKVDEFSPRSVMTTLGIEAPPTADPSALSRVSLEALARARTNVIELSDMTLQLDDTTFNGSLGVPRSSAGSFRFDLKGDAIDLDRYMAPADESNAAADADAAPVEIPADMIRPLKAQGNLAIATVNVGGLTLNDVVLGLNAADGRLRMHPIASALYGGTYNGDVRIDASGAVPVLSVNETIANVDLARLAQAMFEQDNITGSINGNFKLSGRGADLAAVQQSLSGNMSFTLADGAYEGTDIWYELRRARAMLKQETPPEPVLPARTKFSSVSATGVVTNGVMQNDDFVAELPFMELTGRGSVNIPAATVDYSLSARVFEKPEGMAGASEEEIADLTKAVIPLKISGPLASPSVTPDVEALLRQRVEEEVKDKLNKALKDIFDQ